MKGTKKIRDGTEYQVPVRPVSGIRYVICGL